MLYRLKKWLWKDSQPVPKESLRRLSLLEERIGLEIPEGYYQLFQKALRHRSALEQETFQSHETYERLEFLGDAVLDLIVTEILFEKYPTEDEGFLTKLRAKIVRGDSLFEMARNLQLSDFLEVGERSVGQNLEYSKSVLSDVYEALVAAIYISRGFDAAHQFVASNLEKYIDFDKLEKKVDNYKSVLMEYSQSEKLPLPKYKVIDEKGPGHNKTFYVSVSIGKEELGEGVGKSKKGAEQEAARDALSRLGIK